MLTGTPRDLDRVQALIGAKASAAAVTDFVFFGVGMAVGARMIERLEEDGYLPPEGIWPSYRALWKALIRP